MFGFSEVVARICAQWAKAQWALEFRELEVSNFNMGSVSPVISNLGSQ